MIKKQEKRDVFQYHKLALAPFIEPNPANAFEKISCDLQNTEKDFWNFIQFHNMAPIWYATLKKNNADSCVTIDILKMLKEQAFQSTINYLKQKQILLDIRPIFIEANIRHVVYKGAHIREQLYSPQALRPSCDIDILVSQSDKVQVLKILSANAFEIRPSAKDISHEISLTRNTVTVDLHWEILRSGRTRSNLTEELIKNGKEYSTYRGLNNEATLFIMLVHPVFAKYTSSAQASLIRMIDLIKWLQIQSIDLDKVISLLEFGGVKTAAWITCTWLKLLTGIELPKSFMQAIQPSKLKKVYLEFWLRTNLTSSLSNYPLLIKAGFTLPAHDNVNDAYRAVSQLFVEKKKADEKLANTLRNVRL